MNVLMIVFLMVGEIAMGPIKLEVEMASIQACVAAGGAIASNMPAIGLCIDKNTGAVAFWGKADGSDRQPPPQENVQ